MLRSVVPSTPFLRFVAWAVLLLGVGGGGWHVWWWLDASALRVAQACLERGESDRALTAAASYLNKHPRDPRASRVAALTLSRSGQAAAAERHFENARSVLSADEYRTRVRNLIALQWQDRVEFALSEMLHRWPNDPWALRNMAAIHAQFGRNADAIALARRLTQDRAHAAIGYALLGTIYQRTDNVESAVESYTQAIRIDPELKSVPDRLALLKTLGGALHRLGRCDEAERILSVALAARLDAETLHLLGAVRFSKGDTAGAESKWREAIHVDATYTPALVDLGSLALASGRTPEAIEFLESAVRANPHSRSAHYGLGRAYQRIGRVDRAQEHLSRANELE